MHWQLCLVVFFSCGSLLYLVESTVYKSGVQHDVLISNLVAAGCVSCYETPHGSVSKLQDITSCTGPYLFVGTQIRDKQVLEIGALTSVQVLRIESTRSEPYLSNGVHWHFVKGCSFGFTAVDYDDNSIDGENRDSVFSTSSRRAVSWNIDQSIGCTSDDELKTHSIVDTPSWTKHVHNCPAGYPASALFSEERQHGIKEQGGVRGVRRGGTYDGRASIDLSQSLQLAKNVTLDTNVTLYAIQAYTSRSWLSEDTLLAAVTKTVKVVTNVNEVVISFMYFDRNTTYNRKGSRNITEVHYSARLLESKSKIVLTRLNSISDKIFASNISTFLGVPVTVKTKRKWFIYDGPNEKDYGDTRLSFVGLIYVVIVIVVVLMWVCKHLWRIAKIIHKHCTANENPSTVGGAEAEAGAVGVGVGETRLTTQTTLQVAPSAPPVIAVIARRLPSAQATLISSEEAMMYETAAAEVTSDAV